MIHFIRPKESTETPSGPLPGMIEILGLYLLTFSLSFFFLQQSTHFIPSNYSALISIASHIPMFVIPWVWFHFRVRTRVQNVKIWQWTKGSLIPLLLICSWLIPLQILGNLDGVGKPMPNWFQNGTGSILTQILFQGLIVGFSEEMFMRPVIHQTLLAKNLGGFRIFKRLYLSTPLLLTALLFGLLHIGNIGHQPIGYTIMQVAYAFIIGIIFGVYYERTRNYIATSILHNVLDFVAVAAVLLVALTR